MENDGILLIDKDFGLTSSETVQRARRICRISRIGHTGTLDPYATGLLILALGKATKISAFLGTQRKSYLAQIRLGQTRETYDRFGRILSRSEQRPESGQIEGVLAKFAGKTTQPVPAHSAMRYQGRRLYEYARQGKEVPEIYKAIEIYKLEMLSYAWPILKLDITCSAGTYIRSLAQQVGIGLGCGAHLFSLRRTAIGNYSVERAISLLQLQAMLKMGLARECLIPLPKALPFPAILIADAGSEGVINGRDIMNKDIQGLENEFARGDLIGIKNISGSLLAVGTALLSSQECRQSIGREKIFEYRRVI